MNSEKRKSWYFQILYQKKKQQLSEKSIHKIPDRLKKHETNIERIMKRILRELFIDYEFQFPIKWANTYKIYDFKISNKNILIEVDGEYWHSAEDVKKNFMHLKNKKNDYLKNIIAKKRGYKLIRIWGKDLQEKYDDVKQRISEEIINY